VAGFLIPAERLTANALPPSRLPCQPGFCTLFAQRFKLAHHFAMVKSSIIAECLQACTWKLRAQTAMKESLALRAGAQRALRTTRMNRKHIRAATVTEETLWWSLAFRDERF
jgi:hypothetical protein